MSDAFAPFLADLEADRESLRARLRRPTLGTAGATQIPTTAGSWPADPDDGTLQQFDHTVARQQRRVHDPRVSGEALVTRGDAMTATDLAALRQRDPKALLRLLQDPQTARKVVIAPRANAHDPTRQAPQTIAELALAEHGDEAAVAIARSPYSHRLPTANGTPLGEQAERQSSLAREVVRQDGGRGRAPEDPAAYAAASRLVDAKTRADTARTWGLGALTGKSVRQAVEGPPPPVQRAVDSQAPRSAKREAVETAVERASPDVVSALQEPSLTTRTRLTGLEPTRNAAETRVVAQWNATEAAREGNVGLADAAALAAAAAEAPIRDRPQISAHTKPASARL